MTIFWWLVILAACVGMYCAVRVRRAERRKPHGVSSWANDELARRADQQDRWAQRGKPGASTASKVPS